jgi:hypothetical protein
LLREGWCESPLLSSCVRVGEVKSRSRRCSAIACLSMTQRCSAWQGKGMRALIFRFEKGGFSYRIGRGIGAIAPLSFL